MDSKKAEEFRDSEIFNEKVTLEIVNSTGVDGLGSKVGFLLSNLGVNVISIRNGEANNTKISVKGKGSQTLGRIEKLFKVKAQADETNSIADITINIGKDSL